MLSIHVEHGCILMTATPQKRSGRGTRTNLCPTCKKIRDGGSKYCRACANARAREWRKTHPLNPEQRKKAIIRAKVKMRLRRGLLIKYPCEVCDDPKVEAHHDNYEHPYCVRWLCRKCHNDWHKNQREQIR